MAKAMEYKLSSFVEITSEDFAKYPHGFAYISSVDGRGNYLVFGVFKKHGSKRRGNKRLYSFAGLLCYAGGEFRNGFVKENVTEVEVLSLVQLYIRAAHKSIPLVKATAEDVSAFVIKHCLERVSKKLPQAQPNLEADKAVQLFLNSFKFWHHLNTNQYLIHELGAALKGPKFSFLDLRRREFQSWWMELTELEHDKLPTPPAKASTKMTLWDYVQLLSEDLHNESNYERFAYMCRHMGFWYLNSKEANSLKLASTLLMTFDRILERKRNETRFSAENVLINLMAAQTQMKHTQLGFYESNTKKPILNLATTRKSCNMCGSPVQRGMADNDLNCVTKEGDECLGDEGLRDVFSAICHGIRDMGVPVTILRQIHQVFTAAFRVFLTHCFNAHLFWKEIPTPVMTDNLAEKCSLLVLRMLIKNRKAGWKNDLPRSLNSMIKSTCGMKVSPESIKIVTGRLKDTLKSFKVSECSLACDKKHLSKKVHSMDCRVIALKAFVVAPAIGGYLKVRWNLISERRRKKLLECDTGMANKALISVYRTTTTMVVEKLNALKNDMKKNSQKSSKQNKDKDNDDSKNEKVKKQLCRDTECPCHLFSRFKDYFFMVIPIVCERGNSLLTWTQTIKDLCEAEVDDDIGGKLSISYPGFLNNENDILSDLISGHGDDFVTQSAGLACDGLQQSCPLLDILVSTAYLKIFLAIIYQIIQEFSEAPLLEDEYTPVSKGYYRPKCAGCHWEEETNAVFLVCGGCKEVYYCGESCQKSHWKNEHKKQCKKTSTSTINKKVQKLKK